MCLNGCPFDGLRTPTLELWLLEDTSIVCAACVRVEYEGGRYVTEYRTIKGDPVRSEMCLDLDDLSEALDELCGPCFENEQPVYEL